ncbi:MAG: RDD family protein [Rhodobacter sp.]|nr:RDD family protein [Rhodobacter sp.]
MPPMYTTLPDPDHQAEFYADVPIKRALAWVVDAILIAIVTMVVVPFTLFLSLFFLPALYLTISFLYRTISLARHSSTPGMRLMAIEFRDRTGAKFDLGTAFLHTLGYTLTISTLLPQLLSMGLMLTTARGQGLTDLVLGTVAINKPARN